MILNSVEKTKSPADLLQESVDMFRLKHEMYGDNYKNFGKVMASLFPNGIKEFFDDQVDHWNRIGVLVQIVSKLTRYCENYTKGGHDDSLLDLSVYASMLRELDLEIAKRNEIPF